MTISVTLLCSYLYCPRKIFLERVLGFFEPPKEAMVIGTIKHQIMEMINLVDKNIVTNIKPGITIDDLEIEYKKIYTLNTKKILKKNKPRYKKFSLTQKDIFPKIWPIILSQSKIRSMNVISFILKHNIYGQELWENLTPKIRSEIKIKSQNLGLSGIIDQIEIYEKGYVPIELKSGSTPKEDVWPGHRIQLGAYALLLEEHFKTEIKEGFVHYLDSDEKRHVPVNIFLKEEVNDLKNKVSLLLNSKTLPDLVDNENKCKVCGIKDICKDQNKLNKAIKKLKNKKNPL